MDLLSKYHGPTNFNVVNKELDDILEFAIEEGAKASRSKKELQTNIYEKLFLELAKHDYTLAKLDWKEGNWEAKFNSRVYEYSIDIRNRDNFKVNMEGKCATDYIDALMRKA